MQLSIIVPFHNAQKYIEQCLTSICEQDYDASDYEVIAVDDASTDDSNRIVEELKNKYRTIKLLKLSTNIKQGGARNAGLRIAKGEWIWFIDADDYLKPHCLDELMSYCEEGIDVVHFDYVFDKDGHIENSPNPQIGTMKLTGQELLNNPNHNWWTTCVNVWQRIVRKDFIIRNSLSFAENVQYEDTDYSLKLMAVAKKIKHIDVTPYIYRENPSSTIHKVVDGTVLSYKYMSAVRCCDLMHLTGIEARTSETIRKYIQFIVYDISRNLDAIKGEKAKTLRNAMSIESAIKVLLSVKWKPRLTLLRILVKCQFIH